MLPLKSPRRSPRIIDKENNSPNLNAVVKTPSLLKEAINNNRKRVSFGANLSPEYFDKRLPPSTPVRRGESPTRSPFRRKSEPFYRKTPAPNKRRCSVATGLSTIPIAEGEEENENVNPLLLQFDSSGTVDSVVDIFANSPSMRQDLPPPLQAEVLTQENISSSEETELQEVQEKKKKKLATPLRAEIKKGISLKSKKKLATPLRKDIVKGRVLRATKPRLLTPLRSSIKAGVTLKNTKPKTPVKPVGQKKLPTPVRDEIHTAPKLKSVKHKLPAALKEDILSGRKLKSTKKKVLKTPLKRAIEKKPSLRQTLRKGLKTPVRKQIKEG